MNETLALNTLARQVRQDIVEMVYRAGSGHLGGSLSAVEILLSLYFEQMNLRPEDPL
jgi:transketolase